MKKLLLLTAVMASVALHSLAQTSDSLLQLPSSYLDNVLSKASQLQQKLDSKSEKALQQLLNQENKIKRKLVKIDSLKAKELFGNAEQQYKELEQRLEKGLTLQQYIPAMDTASTVLKFLQQNPQLFSSIKNGDRKLKEALNKVKGLEGQLQKTEEIKKFIKERRQYLKNQLEQFGLAKEMKKFSRQGYYAVEQLSSYSELIKDHKKAERKALELLCKTNLFQNFMRKNSMLASFFRLPNDPNNPVTNASLAGLQTRAQVTSLIQQQISNGGPNALQQLQQNVQEAQSQLTKLKDKVTQLGSGGNEAEMPEGFKKNTQRTKSFWKKWEAGFNIQSNRSNNVFPVSSDLGISAGFRPHDNFILGIGFAGRIGWGKNIRHIDITYSGIGIRSFTELKIKGSFHAATGFEMNYRPEIRNIEQLKDKSSWQASGLAGLSKVVSLKTKFFKKTKLQLLWDFLSYQQVPRTQPIIFRVGYNIP